MQLARVQEDERGWELHLYECDKCNSQETYIVKKVGVRDCEHDAGRSIRAIKKSPGSRRGARGFKFCSHIGGTVTVHPSLSYARRMR
jgi:hypothetical protein